jgi:hypothetical protein
MKSSAIKLGYSVPGGKVVNIDPSHLIVTGITQQSGKTTTLEALISRNPKSKAIVFKTKPGENTNMKTIIQSLITCALFLLVYSCGGKKTGIINPSQPDTTKTVALFLVEPDKGIRVDYVVRIVKDTMMYSDIDSADNKITATKKTVSDTSYFIPYVDTVRHQSGLAKLDSMGKVRFGVYWMPTYRSNIIKDFNYTVKGLFGK